MRLIAGSYLITLQAITACTAIPLEEQPPPKASSDTERDGI